MSKAATAAAAAPEAPAEGEGAKKGKGKLILLIVLGLVLVGGGVGGFLFWKSRQAEHAKVAPKPPPPPLQFFALDPPFVVNFQGAQSVRFLQIEVRIASRELETIELLKANDPIVRNDLLLLFGAQDSAQLATREGKEKLRNDALAQVRRIVKEVGGKPESVDTVLFTSFVMQ